MEGTPDVIQNYPMCIYKISILDLSKQLINLCRFVNYLIENTEE